MKRYTEGLPRGTAKRIRDTHGSPTLCILLGTRELTFSSSLVCLSGVLDSVASPGTSVSCSKYVPMEDSELNKLRRSLELSRNVGRSQADVMTLVRKISNDFQACILRLAAAGRNQSIPNIGTA